MPKQKSPPIPGLVHITLQIPKELHEGMKAIRQARRRIEQGEVRLNRVYREAIQFYLNARQQRVLLETEEADEVCA